MPHNITFEFGKPSRRNICSMLDHDQTKMWPYLAVVPWRVLEVLLWEATGDRETHMSHLGEQGFNTNIYNSILFSNP